MARDRRKGARPACPDHEGSRVVFDGLYGAPGHERQRFRCYPGGVGGVGKPWHRFTEALPRQATPGSVCVLCEREVHPHEGPQTPRDYEFAARHIAEALYAVGRGDTYREAAARARNRAGRFPTGHDGVQRYTRHGQMVGDWVELFAPVVFEPHRRWTWPEEGSLLLDHIGFRVKAWREDGTPVTGPVAFNVLAAAGYDNGVMRVWRLASAPTVHTDDWLGFLHALDGTPERVVTDGHAGTIKAARRIWPEANHWRSEWHFRDALHDYLRKAGLHGDTREMKALNQAFINRYWWEHFTVIAWRTGIPRLRSWLDDYGELVEHQLANRPLLTERRVNPLSLGGLDRTKLDRLKRWLEPRATGFSNRERLDRLLMLMQLHLNELDDVDAYAIAIRDWLIANDGRPAHTRRAITDSKGSPSLLSPAAITARELAKALRAANPPRRSRTRRT